MYRLFLYTFMILIQFLSGSVMYSYILAKIKGVNLRQVRDGNPGSSNLWRAAGFKWGFPALALDYFKGVFPLALFTWNENIHFNVYVVSLAALAGIAGHAFSPFLKFKGGKAIATTFGAWSVMTKWEAPVLLGTVFTSFSIWNKFAGNSKTTPEKDALRVFFGFFALFIYTIWRLFQGRLELLILYVGNLAIIIYKHRYEIKKLMMKTVQKRS